MFNGISYVQQTFDSMEDIQIKVKEELNFAPEEITIKEEFNSE